MVERKMIIFPMPTFPEFALYLLIFFAGLIIAYAVHANFFVTRESALNALATCINQCGGRYSILFPGNITPPTIPLQ